MDRVGLVVEQIVVKLPITGVELLLLQEQRVIHQRQRIEHVKLGLLGKNEHISHEGIKTSLESRAVVRALESNIRGVVEEVGGANGRVLLGPDDRRLEAVEGEEVGDFAVVALETC